MFDWSRSKSSRGVLVFVSILLILVIGTVRVTPSVAADDWQRLIVEAKKEGAVSLYSSSGPKVREMLGSFFKQKFGINLEWTMGRPGELAARVLTEQRAGLYIPDVMLDGGSNVPQLKPAGALQSLDNVLFLPEVLDKKAWFGGKLGWCDDPGHHWVGILAYPVPAVVINTRLVNPEEVKSYRDLLNPKWKGKMVIDDPTKAGAGGSWFAAMVQGIMNVDYMREFVKQKPVIINNARQQAEWVARGKYPIGIAIRGETRAQFVQEGFPMGMVSPEEGVHLTSSAGGVAMLRKVPHPNATKLFLNWVLTKEGATLVAKSMGAQSARLDVPVDFVPPEMRRQSGVKYFSTLGWDYQVSKAKMIELAKEVFAPLMK